MEIYTASNDRKIHDVFTSAARGGQKSPIIFSVIVARIIIGLFCPPLEPVVVKRKVRLSSLEQRAR